MAKFDPSQIQTPKPIAKKIGMDDQVGEGTGYAKFGGSSGEMCVFWNYHSFFTYIYIYTYIYLFFSSPNLQVRPLNGS